MIYFNGNNRTWDDNVKIKVNTNFLKDKADKIDIYTQDISSNINKIRTEISSVGNVWRDGNYVNFSRKMETFIQELNRFNAEISNCQRVVSDYAKRYDDLESKYSSILNIK